jgi:hypothetical protein
MGCRVHLQETAWGFGSKFKIMDPDTLAILIPEIIPFLGNRFDQIIYVVVSVWTVQHPVEHLSIIQSVTIPACRWGL